MAPRFHSEQLLGTVERTVTYELQQRQVTVIDHEVQSPGGRCPMERSYLNVPTPQALQISRTCGGTSSSSRSSRLHVQLTRRSARRGARRTASATS